MPPLRADRQLRAPVENGGVLHEPDWAHWPDALAHNRGQIESTGITLLGRSLPELAITAREEVLQHALAYTRRYRDSTTISGNLSPAQTPAMVMAGHQPQLYHPGVWYKNFALSRLADNVNAIAVNLVIDSDLCRITDIPVPTGSIRNLQVTQLPFDTCGRDIPFEQRPVQDEEMFQSWADRVSAALAPPIANPLAEELRPLVLSRAASERNLGRSLAQGRHLIESRWLTAAGMRPTLELPQSMVCQLSAFRWFVVHLLANLPTFVAIHNEALAEYRRAYHIRSASRPVPDLATDADWLETPFWVWSNADPFRRRLFARWNADGVALSDRHNMNRSLRSAAEDPTTAIDQLSTLEGDGIKIRTRALTTTLFARLLLCDYFIHGIGGAKYDEVTDQTIEKFYGLAPPNFGIASATLRLPIPGATNRPLDEREIRRRLRDLRFNPDRWICQEDLPATQLSKFLNLRGEKRRWIATSKTPANSKQRHNAIAAINHELQPLVEFDKLALRTELSLSAETQRMSKILQSREFAYCLFPADELQRLLLDSWRPGT